MLPRTRSGRSLLAAASILAASTALVAAGRSLTSPYMPSAPAHRSHGPDGAPVTIAIFSDFQCGGCNAARGQIETIEKMFPGKIRVLYKHLPWSFHIWGKAAAVAAECAGRQGKFWELHDRIFDDQGAWSRVEKAEEVKAAFLGYADGMIPDRAAFEKCVSAAETLEGVTADYDEAQAHFVNVTPTFFINGRRFTGGTQLRTFGLNHIEDLLRQ